MSLSDENRDDLLNMALLLNNQLSGTQPDELRRHSAGIMEQLCCHLNVPHAHFLVVRRSAHEEKRVSLYAEWSSPPAPELGQGLHKVDVHFFGENAFKTLRSGQPFFSTFDSNNNACSKLVSGILRELGLTSYEMIPIIVQNRLTGIIGLAHSGQVEDLDGTSRSLIQMIGNSLMQTILCARRERTRRRHQRQWKRVANGACDFALRVDSRLEITGVIPFRQKTPPQLTGLPLSEFVASSSCESLIETIQESVSISEPRLVQFYAINESARPCSYVARIEPASSRSRRRDLTLYLTNNDVERAHADELARLREQLDRSARLSLLGNIATEFAYQLTLPLQAVENYLYTLTRRLKRFQPHESMLPCAENIALSLDHARGIIDGLREFVTNRQMKPADTELSRQVRTALTMVGAQAERAGVRITIDDPHLWIEGQESPVVFVDPVQTTHVMISLIVNAIEACTIAKTDRPEITITLEPDENPKMVMVRVSDNGTGIPPGQFERVFDRFYSTRSDGFGVGLAICREIIESQGGTIYARNNAKRGCTFFFTLPLSTNQDRTKDDLSDDST